MDLSPQEPILTTAASPQVLGPSSSVPKPPDPPTNRMTQSANQADAMAIKVERLSQQKERDKEQFKEVLRQWEEEFTQAKERYQRELDQNKASHQAHPKEIEDNIIATETNQANQSQQTQREFELTFHAYAAKNAVLEEELLLNQQSQEEKEVARAILISQTAESAIEV